MRISGVAATVAMIVLTAVPARSSEIFICRDGRTIEVNASNRRQLKSDPCIAEWFEQNAKRSGKPSSVETSPSMTRGKDERGGSGYGHYGNDGYDSVYAPYSYGHSPWFY